MGTEVVFELDVRNTLLIYFFTGIGINARIIELINAGKPLLIMLLLTLGYVIAQNVVGIAGASIVGSDTHP